MLSVHTYVCVNTHPGTDPDWGDHPATAEPHHNGRQDRRVQASATAAKSSSPQGK